MAAFEERAREFYRAREREGRCTLAEELLHRSLEDRLGQVHNWAWDAFEEDSAEGDELSRRYAQSSRRILKALAEVGRIAAQHEEDTSDSEERQRMRQEASARVGVHLVGLAELEEAIAERKEKMERRAFAGVASGAVHREAAALLTLRSAHLTLLSTMKKHTADPTHELAKARAALFMAFEELDAIRGEVGATFGAN